MRLRLLAQAGKYFILVFGMILILIPIYITTASSMKPISDSRSFFAPPASFYLGNFIEVIGAGRYWTFLTNSVVITVVSVAVMMLLIPMVSYAISRNFNKTYYFYLYLFILSGIFIPFQVIMLPIVKHMDKLHLMNQAGLIVMYVTLAFTQGTFLTVGFLKNIPMELDEASKIDGCSVLQTFLRIIYPLILPIMATILILNSLWIWNDFTLPLILLNKNNSFWTLPLFIYNFRTETSFNYHLAFAGFFMSMLPIIVLYGFVQRFIISGLTEGALK